MAVKSSRNFKVFKILSIGQRGVGKTVFLAGSHIELQRMESALLKETNNLLFQCEDEESEDNLTKIVRYIENKGDYPPPTMKITDFSFDLYQKSVSKTQKLCSFIWSDIPGEICENSSKEFREMVYASQGCCAFIDIDALISKDSYLQELTGIIEQITVIANLTKLNNLPYPFSIILTKCDLISPKPETKERVESELQILTNRLHNLGIKYRVFFSFIPLENNLDKVIMQPQGAAISLLWLVSELEKTYRKNVNRYVSNLALKQSQSTNLGALQSIFTASMNEERSRKRFSWLGDRTSTLVPAAIASGLVLTAGLIALLPNILPSANISQSEIEQRQLEESISELEKLTQAEPNSWEWKLQLAELYQANRDYVKAEQMYDSVIAQQPNHLAALIKKAQLRQRQGDGQTAAALFFQAEQAAPNDQLKAEIRRISQQGK